MRSVRHTHLCSQAFVTVSPPLACRSTPWNKQLASSACCAWRGSQASSRQCSPALEALGTSTNSCAVGYREDAGDARGAWSCERGVLEALLSLAWLEATCAVPCHPCRPPQTPTRAGGRGLQSRGAGPRTGSGHPHAAPRAPRGQAAGPRGQAADVCGLFMARGSRTMLPN